MSLRCDFCRRKSGRSVSRSHSNIATLRRQYLNLQKKTIDGVRHTICTGCIKTRTKQASST